MGDGLERVSVDSVLKISTAVDIPVDNENNGLELQLNGKYLEVTLYVLSTI